MEVRSEPQHFHIGEPEGTEHFFIGGPEFKVLLLGDGRVGKTSFLLRHKSGEFVKRYRPTEARERCRSTTVICKYQNI